MVIFGTIKDEFIGNLYCVANLLDGYSRKLFSSVKSNPNLLESKWFS